MVGLAENKATQPSLAGAWAELGKNVKFLNYFPVLKHAQEDGISNPLGSREIQEIKVATVLRRTIYFGQNVLSCCNFYINFPKSKCDSVLCCLNVMFLMTELVNEILMLFTMLVSNKTSMISKKQKKRLLLQPWTENNYSIVLNFPEFLFTNLQFYISGVVLEWMNG